MLGKKLREIRLQKGLSIQDVVGLSGGMLDKTMLSRLERNERGISLRGAYCLSKIYGIEMETLAEMAIGREVVIREIPFDTSPEERDMILRFRSLDGKYRKLSFEIIRGFSLIGDFKSAGDARERVARKLEDSGDL